MDDTSASWMVNSHPGKILAAVMDAQNKVLAVGKSKGGGMTYQDADEVILSATTAIGAAGLLYQMRLTSPMIEATATVGDQVSVTAILVLIHPEDGSLIQFEATGISLINKMGKYGAAASTGARKQVWLTALGITAGENEPEEKPEDTPEEIEYLIAELEACQTRDDLRAVTALDEYRAVRGRWRSVLRHVGRDREQWLSRLGWNSPPRQAQPRDDVPEGEQRRSDRKFDKK